MKKLIQWMKRKWNNYLEGLIKTNRELYGNKRLNCRGINRTKEKNI